MKHLWLILLSIMVGATLPAAENSDPKSLQGEWVPIKAILGGKPMPEAALKTISLKLNNGTYEVVANGQLDKGNYEIDPSTKPKGMVIKGTEGPNKGKTIPAIYEFSGNTVRICYDLSGPGAKRPSEFKSTEGTKLYLVTYERKK